MNQESRKFLIEQVNKTYKERLSELNESLPVKPSLNNYLVAACLDNTLQMQDVKELRKRIRERVLKFGKSDQLVKEEDDWRNNNRGEDEVLLSASDLFVFPAAYLMAMREYKSKKEIIQEQCRSISATRDTIVLKIQIGSPAVLAKLVEQVDNLADLTLMNSNLLLTEPEKKIAPSKKK